MTEEIEVRLDRVGGEYRVGETVTGVVVVRNSSSTSHSGVLLSVDGRIIPTLNPRCTSSLDHILAQLKPLPMLTLELTLAQAGKMPEGIVEMPFAFPLTPSKPPQPLLETYQGVYINSTYELCATISKTLGSKVSRPLTFNLVCPKQAMPPLSAIQADQGIPFELSSETLRTARKFHGDRVPKFKVEGFLDKYWNDIDVPLSGWIRVDEADFRIVSLEIQLVRAEYCAIPGAASREATEIQNIQIGDGDVMRGFAIPIYMMFPRWYTCPCLFSTNMKVEFEINVVITSEDKNQLTQNLPIKLFRSEC